MRTPIHDIIAFALLLPIVASLFVLAIATL